MDDVWNCWSGWQPCAEPSIPVEDARSRPGEGVTGTTNMDNTEEFYQNFVQTGSHIGFWVLGLADAEKQLAGAENQNRKHTEAIDGL